MPSLFDLLSDRGAQIELVVIGYYLDENNVQHTEAISQTGWEDQISGPYAAYIPPLLASSLRINLRIDPLDPSSSLDTFGDIEISNNHLDYAGRYDGWWQYSVDGQSWVIYAVGVLSDGTRVELSDVINTPLFDLQGISIPEVGSDTCLIRCKNTRSLDTPLQPITYSPPALYFPGTLTAIVNLGNNLSITGTQSISAWIYLEDPATTIQYIEFKDSGTTGHYIAVGLVGAGTIAAGVEILVRGQAPTTTTTAANVLQANRWHRIDISIDTTTRRIDIDGVTAITTSAITGTPTASAVNLEIGRSLKGRIHRLSHWTNARSNSTMSPEGRIPIVTTGAALREHFMFLEGRGTQVASTKLGSTLIGTLAAGVLWENASWHYDSILGQYEPYVLGTVPRVPVTWIDPPKQIGQVSRGEIALLSELQSNHTIVSTANYTVNTANGTVTVTVGALSGTYSATVTANNLWNSALLFAATSSAIATITSPTGSRSIGVQFRPDFTDISFHSLIGWDVTGAAVGRFFLRFNSGTLPTDPNRIQAYAINDAGVNFQVSPAAGLKQGRTYTAIASLNTSASIVNGQAANSLYLYIDGTLAGTVTISGAWTTALTGFGVGVRAFDLTRNWVGRLDEPFVFNRVITAAEARSFCTKPLIGTESGLTYAWHLDTSAAPFAGATSLTLANTTYTAGRSSCTDLSRTIMYRAGFVESDLDFDSWFDALIACPYPCGWYVSGGIKSIDVLNIILGGLGFILYESAGLIKIRRFKSLSGTPDVELDPIIDLQSQPVESNPADPAIYQWTVNFATNNSKQDQANIAGGLATTDPDRYHYGAEDYRSAIKSDGSILQRFPSTIPMTRMTALLNLADAEAEAVRLLSVHRYGADRKSVSALLNVGSVEILDELGPLMEEANLDDGDLIVIGLSIEDGLATLTIWRPSTA